jgi:pimeloyl-ACP methyl ester carboxylesterase
MDYDMHYYSHISKEGSMVSDHKQKTGTKFIQLEDGRKLAYNEYGDPQGKPAFYFHGTPGSRLEAEFTDDAAIKFNFRLIAPDRPGIGKSDYKSGRKLLEWPKDVVRLADHLKLEKFGVIGASGGGPSALACAHEIPDRLDFVICLAGWAPISFKHRTQDMNKLDQFFANLSKTRPQMLTVPFSLIGYVAKRFPKKLREFVSSSLSEADKMMLADPDVERILTKDIQEAFHQGSQGVSDDALLCYNNWGFEVSDIKVPVLLLHGTADTIVPFSFAQYLHHKIPNNTFLTYPNEGHYFMVTRFGEVFEKLSRPTINRQTDSTEEYPPREKHIVTKT